MTKPLTCSGTSLAKRKIIFPEKEFQIINAGGNDNAVKNSLNIK